MIDVAELRKRLGYKTQAAFAERLGVDQSTVSRLESGEMEATGPLRVLLLQLIEDLDRSEKNQTPKKTSKLGAAAE